MKPVLIIHRPDLVGFLGLGDVVASIAQPIARAIDKVAGTNVAGCGGCKKRQEALNQAIPFSLPENGAGDTPQ